jgi:glycosyltransferase involved in cell wall biosynthesis
MRVLMTADSVGGVWSYATALLRALPQVELTLAVMGPAPREALPGMAHAPFKLEWMEAPWEDVARAGEWLLELAAEHRPDLVHLNGYVHAALPWQAPVLVVAHSCVLSWWEAVEGAPAPARWRRYREAVAAGLAAADAVVAPSRTMLGAVTRHYGRPREAHVIPNGIDRAAVRRAPKEEFVFAAGRVWDEAKNLAALDRRFDWPVLVAGETEGREFAHARTLGRLAPGEVADHMARAAIYAFPAKYEPFGLSVLEAAAAGCALVLGDIPSLRENWEDAALFGLDHLPRLVSDPALRDEYASRALERAQRFPIERTAAAYHDLYRKLCAASPRKRRPGEAVARFRVGADQAAEKPERAA